MTRPVTVETFAEAEVDARLFRFQNEEGGLNRGIVYEVPTPTDNQAVPRMNRDTLYAGIPVDTAEGYSITIPEHPADRYVSVYVLDNEHMTLHVLRGAGAHALDPAPTRYVIAIPRVQLFDQTDPDDVAAALEILRAITVESDSTEPKPMVDWDWDAMLELRASYETAYHREGIAQYPSNWQGERGTVDRSKGHNIAVACAWGLFPDTEAVYIAQSPGLPADGCYSATYQVPDHQAFWSITVYNGDGYLFSDRNNLNSASLAYNDDGTVTVHYGSAEACGDVTNRLDITDGWNILLRVYRPGPSVTAGDYVLPKIAEA